MPEKQWSCGCMEVDGKLVQECKQSEFNPVCFRKAQENRPERRVTTQPPPVAPIEVSNPRHVRFLESEIIRTRLEKDAQSTAPQTATVPVPEVKQ